MNFLTTKISIMKKIMSKELFVESINQLQAQSDHDNKCQDAFNIILPDDRVMGYDNHFVTNQLIKLLQVAMNDEGRDSWIEFFVYELNFGKDQSKDFNAWRKDKSPIDLGDAGKLWNFLNEPK